MRIYCYSQNANLAGRVFGESNTERKTDVFLYARGSRSSIIRKARASLATRYDNRPGGAGDSFRWKCDRNVLLYLGE